VKINVGKPEIKDEKIMVVMVYDCPVSFTSENRLQ